MNDYRFNILVIKSHEKINVEKWNEDKLVSKIIVYN